MLSKGWHNLNARDNAYFLARERVKELEAEIDAKTQSDYNKVLFPLTIIDTNQTKSYKDKTDEIVKKASRAVTWHKNSNYVDDSYILVGKSRVLRGEWKLAAETFRFVNGEGETNERHESLTQLMRLFMLKKDFRSAGYVMDYLQKQTLGNKKNIREFSLSKAQFNRYLEDYASMTKNIEDAIPLVTGKKEKKARLYFILGQIYQLQQQDSIAYLNYKKAIRNNPSYELSFYSKLYLAQVTSLNNASDKKKTERYFKKLLKDKKNLEYKDKIYYEMALFEYKQKKYPTTISYLEKSVYSNKGNKYQKGASYLKLGEIYYGDLKNYEQAKLYYDSTVAIWDPSDKQYREIAERQKVLTEFVKNLLVVRREDSLQRLARMDTATLSKFIDKVIADEEAARLLKEKQAAAAKKRAADIAANSGPQIIDNSLNPADPSNWYFYNATAIARGKTDFTVKWGDRKLTDNWRRSVKDEPLNNNSNDTNAPKDTTSTSSNPKDTTGSASKKPVVNKAKYYDDIPKTEEQLVASDKKIQEALYNLGRIYNLKLNEPADAIKTFEDLLKRYPNYENTAEVLYFLHLINKEQKNTERAEYYRNKLIREYPKSIYAKMLLNPNYLKESKEENKLVASLYKTAFERYEHSDYIAADSMIVIIMRQHPDNDIMDKMKLLRIIITGRTKNALVYKTQLQDFINDKENELSPMLPKAKELLATSDQYLQSLGAEVKATDVRYSTNTSKPHYYVAVFDSRKTKKDVLLKQFTHYNKTYYSEMNLQTELLNLSDTSFAVVVKTFEAMYPSKQYSDKINTPGGNTKPFQSSISTTFFISDDNYKLFYKDKGVATYVEFFKKNY